MLNFFHNFTPSPIFWQIGPLTIRYYGLIIALAIAAGVYVAIKLAKQQKIVLDDLLDLAFWVTIFGIIGARLYEALILEPNYFLIHPVEIIKIWHGGLAIHGAIIGGLITLIVWCRKKRQNFWQWADLIAVILPLGQAIGRWGNYFNQEVFGWPTNLPWGIPISFNNRPLEFITEKYFQPTFLYESFLDFILFLTLVFLYKKQSLKTSQYLGSYLIGYGLIRFLMEFIRIDQTAMIFGWRWPQVFSLMLMFIGLIIFAKRKTPA